MMRRLRIVSCSLVVGLASMLALAQVTEDKVLEYLELAKAGNPAAQFNLGVIYSQGLGVPVNLEMAFDWYHEAAEQGMPQAEYQTGLALDQGLGTKVDQKKAAKWYKRAAEQEIPAAAFNLGVLCDQGLGVKQDQTKALQWYRVAANGGLPVAQHNLGLLLAETGKHVEAWAWLHTAFESGHVDSATPRDALTELLSPDALKEARRKYLQINADLS